MVGCAQRCIQQCVSFRTNGLISFKKILIQKHNKPLNFIAISRYSSLVIQPETRAYWAVIYSCVMTVLIS